MPTMFPDSPRSSSRGATRNEIVEVSAALLADGVDISLRGIASRMGLTAPALYRYVRTRDELLEMVVFELDRQPTAEFRAAAGRYAEDDPLLGLRPRPSRCAAGLSRGPTSFDWHSSISARQPAPARTNCSRRQRRPPSSATCCGIRAGRTAPLVTRRSLWPRSKLGPAFTA